VNSEPSAEGLTPISVKYAADPDNYLGTFGDIVGIYRRTQRRPLSTSFMIKESPFWQQVMLRKHQGLAVYIVANAL